MDFVIYPPSSRGAQPLSSELIQFRNRLTQNVESFNSHYETQQIAFKNQHAVSNMVNIVGDYFGDTPKATYDNIMRRLPLLCGLLGIVYAQPNCKANPVIGDSDIFAYKEMESLVWEGGQIKLKDSPDPVVLMDHNEIAMHLEHYLEPQIKTMGLWFIDLPYFAAMYHQLTANGQRTHSLALTDIIYRRNAARMLNIAVANNVGTWIRRDTVIDFTESAPYFQHNLVELGNRIQSAWVKHFSKYDRGGISDLAYGGIWEDVKALGKKDKINSFYIDHLMVVTAYMDMRYLSRVKTINNVLSLGMSTAKVDNLPEKLLSNNKIGQLIKTLPKEVSAIVRPVLDG